jgi:glutaredoxin 3
MSIKIYSTPTCVYCRMAKDFFKNNNLAYEEYNVASDLKAREEMVQKSHQLGVPVIDIDGEIIVGFDKGTLSKVLHIGS